MVDLSEKEEIYLQKLMSLIGENNSFDLRGNSDLEHFIRHERIYADSLKSKGLINYDAYIGNIIFSLTADGESYFEIKDRYKKQQELHRAVTNNITINASGTNSPINVVQGDGSATQTINHLDENKETKTKKITAGKIFGIIVGIATIIGAIATILALL